MKVLTIFTGGTIGSKVSADGIISTSKAQPFVLLEKYKERYGEDVEFDPIEPYEILSENLSGAELTLLVRTLQEQLEKKEYDGVVITHGTDTLQYTAAILGFLFADCGKPIVLVSSNYVIDDFRANGLYNLKGAVDFIKRKPATGVFVSYKNIGEPVKIHIGTRLENGLQLHDAVHSVMGTYFGSVEDGVFEQVRQENVYGKNARALLTKEMRKQFSLHQTARGILRIQAYPGMVYPEILENVKVVLHESYHSGTICISEGLKEFAKQAQQRHVPIYLTGLDTRAAEYETVSEYRKLGIQVLPERATIAQYCKLWIAIEHGLDIEKIMTEEYALERS